MLLITQLQRLMAEQDSPFRSQFIKEDIERLAKLKTLAEDVSDLETFKSQGLFIGWTQSDMRTHLIRGDVEKFLEHFYCHHNSDGTPQRNAELSSAWTTFNQARMEKLVRCL